VSGTAPEAEEREEGRSEKRSSQHRHSVARLAMPRPCATLP
jgi:hypothetical protein